MGVEPQKIPKRLDRNDRSRRPIPLWKHLLEKHPQTFPRARTQFRKKRTIIKKITAEDLGDAEDKMTMGDLFQNLSAHPFAKLNHSLLVAGRTEVSALAGEGQKIFMAAVCTSDPGKAVAQNATVQITVDHGPQIGTAKPIGLVFPNTEGRKIDGVPLYFAFHEALNKSGITDFRFHDLRHTFASNLIMQEGVEINDIRELLGHKKMDMTLRYAHLSPRHKTRVVNILDRVMSQIPPQAEKVVQLRR